MWSLVRPMLESSPAFMEEVWNISCLKMLTTIAMMIKMRLAANGVIINIEKVNHHLLDTIQTLQLSQPFLSN